MTPEEIAERLKDVADELELSRVRGTFWRGADRWTTIEVSAATMSDSPDGWDVTIEEYEL